MNKAALFCAFLAFVVPIGCVVAFNFGGADIENMMGQSSAAEDKIPTGQLLYFYAPS